MRLAQWFRQRVRVFVIRTYLLFRLFYEANRRPRLAALPENRPRRNQVAPVCLPPYCSRVPEIALLRRGRRGRARSRSTTGLATATRIALTKSDSLRVECDPHFHLLAVADGERGSAWSASSRRSPDDGARATSPSRPTTAGAASARRSSGRSRTGPRSSELDGAPRQHQRATREPRLGAASAGSSEIERNERRLELDLTAFEPPPVDPPEGIEIVTWAERPDAGARALRRHLRGVPGHPRGARTTRSESFEDWLAARHGRPRRPARGDVRRVRRRRGRRLLEVLADGRAADGRLPRPDGRQARVARARDRRCAQARRRSRGRRSTATSGSRRRTRMRNEPIRPPERALRLPAGARAASSCAARSRDARPLRRRQDAVPDQRPTHGAGDDRHDGDRLGAKGAWGCPFAA